MKNFFTLISISATLTLSANVLTPQEALSRLGDGTAPKGAPALNRAGKPSLVHTVMAGEQAGAYVFNNAHGTGYMVLSADDIALPVLGYSESGPFNPQDAPLNLMSWLEGYARQIAWARENNPMPSITADETPTWDDVQPLIKTNWDQGSPYNDWCPLQSGKRSYTGCVATAVAQIMNWHRWPEKAVGEKTYKPWYISGYLHIDYDTVRLEWDKMLPIVTPSSPYENKSAVAALMQAVGYACEMEYTSWSSGALSYKAAAGLINHFGYNKGLILEKREWFRHNEWHQLVYEELTTNGPVYYDGSGDGGGHAFVCDGYRASDGFFHFNWGWSGMSDGYFSLEALSPQTQGAGGVSLDYSWDQACMRGLKKDFEGSEQTVKMASLAGVKTVWEKQKLGNYFTLMGYETGDGFGLYSVNDVDSLLLGAELVNYETGKVYHAPESTLNNGTELEWRCPQQAYTRAQVFRAYLPQTMDEGSYKCYPVYKTGMNDDWHTMVGNAAFRQYINVDIKGDSAFFSIGQPDAKLYADILDMPDFFTSSDNFTIKCRIHNIGTEDFNGTYRGVFLNVEETLSVAGMGYCEFLSLAAGDSIDITYTSKIQDGKIEDGFYGFCIGNATTGEIISPLYEAFVGNRYGELRLSYFDFKIDQQSYVDAGNIHATMQVSCPQGMYDAPMHLLVSESKRNWKHQYTISSQPVQFTAVETKTVEFNTTFKEGILGMTYYIVPGYQDKDGNYIAMSDTYIPITIAKEAPAEAAVDSVVNDNQDTVYYNLQGIRVQNPKNGMYIRHTPDGTMKVMIP